MVLFPHPCRSRCSLSPHEVAPTVRVPAVSAIRRAPTVDTRFAASEIGDAPERGLAVVAEDLALVQLELVRARRCGAVPNLEQETR